MPVSRTSHFRRLGVWRAMASRSETSDALEFDESVLQDLRFRVGMRNQGCISAIGYAAVVMCVGL